MSTPPRSAHGSAPPLAMTWADDAARLSVRVTLGRVAPRTDNKETIGRARAIPAVAGRRLYCASHKTILISVLNALILMLCDAL